MDAQNILSASEAHFRAVLLPHRSLGRKGFVVLMAVTAAVCVFTGVAFLMHGAWPVTGFFGLDLLLIYLAFHMNYRSARAYETVELTPDELRLTRVHPSGRAESWTFNPYWVRLELEEVDNTANRLRLRSHGRVLTFGQFLTNEEKRGFAEALKIALFDVRGGRG